MLDNTRDHDRVLIRGETLEIFYFSQFPLFMLSKPSIYQYIFLMVVTDINPFYFAAIGGVILGIATSINYCLRGKVTGMSGMLYSIFFWNRCILSIIIEDIHEKLSIIGGMLVAAGMFFDIFGYGSSNNFTPYGPEQ